MSEPKHDPLSAEALLHQAAWLRGLARRLVASSHDADELVQETWVAALRAERPAAEAMLRRWLAATARNLARLTYRRERRRVARETVAAGNELLPSAEQVAERLQSQRLVVECLQTLDEPYRSTLVYRFYEGLEPSEIARRLGLPPGTIRARIHRSLQILRGRLESRLGPAAWQRALVPLLRIPGSVSPQPAASAAATAVIGGLVVKKTMLLAATAVLVTTSAGWLLLKPPRPAPPPVSSTTARSDTRGAVAAAANHAVSDTVSDAITREPVADDRVSSAQIPAPGKDQLATTGGTGTVIVEVRDAEGKAMNASGRAWMRVAGPGEHDPNSIDWSRLTEHEASLSGTARFANVPLGRLVQVRIAASDLPSLRDRPLVFVGPKNDGEEKSCAIGIGEGLAVLTGRLIGDHRLPMANTRCVACLYQAIEMDIRIINVGEQYQLKTDGEGYFELDNVTPLFLAERRARFRVDGGTSGDGMIPYRTGDVQVTGPLAPGISDVGDVVVRVEPVLLAGRVVDAEGAGLHDAFIRVATEESGAKSKSSPRVLPRGVLDGRSGQVHPELSVRSASDGSFVVRDSRHIGSRLTIQVACPKYPLQLLSDVTPGTRDLVIQMNAGASLRGRILVDEPAGLAGLRVKASGVLRAASPDAQGQFTVDYVTSPRIDLSVELYGRELYLKSNVPVPRPGEAAAPVEIDLRGHVRNFSLRVVDAEDNAVAGELLRLLVLDGTWEGDVLFCKTDGLGFADIPMPLATEQIRVWSESSRWADIAWRTQRQDVRLAHGNAVCLVLDDDVPLLTAPYSVVITLKPAGDDERRALSWQRFEFDEHREAHGSLPAPGSYSVLPYLHEPMPTGFSERPLALLPDAIEVLDQRSDEQKISVRLHPDAVVAIRAQAAKLRK